jgi:hypothetical protein
MHFFEQRPTWGDFKDVFRGEPTRFEVYTKAGQILHFGFRTWVINDGYDQQLLSPTEISRSRFLVIKVWPLDMVEDRTGKGAGRTSYTRGNYIEIDYCGRAGKPIDSPDVSPRVGFRAIDTQAHGSCGQRGTGSLDTSRHQQTWNALASSESRLA